MVNWSCSRTETRFYSQLARGIDRVPKSHGSEVEPTHRPLRCSCWRTSRVDALRSFPDTLHLSEPRHSIAYRRACFARSAAPFLGRVPQGSIRSSADTRRASRLLTRALLIRLRVDRDKSDITCREGRFHDDNYLRVAQLIDAPPTRSCTATSPRNVYLPHGCGGPAGLAGRAPRPPRPRTGITPWSTSRTTAYPGP